MASNRAALAEGRKKMHTSVAVTAVLNEMARAQAAFPAMRSAHEAVAIIREEYLEFEREVFHGDDFGARAEAIQLAAMVLRFLVDLPRIEPKP